MSDGVAGDPAVWVIRGGEDNRLVDQFVADSVTAVGYYPIPDGSTVSAEEVVRTIRAEGRTVPERRAAMFADFVWAVAPGDVVVMPDTPRREVVVGIIEGGYRFESQLAPERYRHRRAVRWVGRHAIEELPAAWQHLYRQRPTLQRYEAPELIEHASRVAAGEVGRPAASVRRRRTTSSGSAGEPLRTCPACGLNRPPSQFAGHDRCVDCR